MSVADEAGTGPFDPWKLNRDDYSPDKFYTRSTDGQGHKERVWQVVFPPHLHAEMNALIGQRHIAEYRTLQDLIRDAVYHRLRYLNEQIRSESLERTLDLEAVAVCEEQSLAKMRERARVVGSAREVMNLAFMTGDKHELRAFVARMEDRVPQMSEPYARQLQDLLDQARDMLGRMI